MLGRPAPRTIPARTPTIIPATDLGSVEVAKEGNLYLLTDPRGDIRLDGRGLGLYQLDTRILSTSVLRLNGAQMTLLRGPYRDSGADTIQLTNPELRRNPADKRTAASSLGRRELSVTRTRRLEDGVLRDWREGPAESKPGRNRDIAFRDRDEAREASFRGEQVVMAGVEASVGHTVPDREELPHRVEEESKLHVRDECLSAPGEDREAPDQCRRCSRGPLELADERLDSISDIGNGSRLRLASDVEKARQLSRRRFTVIRQVGQGWESSDEGLEGGGAGHHV